MALSAPTSKTTIIDLFAGAGGNSIAFALSNRWAKIFAIERDPTILACAKHNARIYGVDKQIWWIEGDCFDVLKKRLRTLAHESVLFGSPPWGGPGYMGAEVFGLEAMEPYGLGDMMGAFDRFGAGFTVLYLPRTSDLTEIARYHVQRQRLLADEGKGKVRTVHYCMSGASKVCFGRVRWVVH